MNIYRVLDESDACLWQAESMAAALRTAEDAYIRELEKENQNRPLTEEDEKRERTYYSRELLQSCELVGTLANPSA